MTNADDGLTYEELKALAKAEGRPLESMCALGCAGAFARLLGPLALKYQRESRKSSPAHEFGGKFLDCGYGCCKDESGAPQATTARRNLNH